MWVIVVQNEGTPSPSVVGPFDTAEKAAAYGKTLKSFTDNVALATLNPPPVE